MKAGRRRMKTPDQSAGASGVKGREGGDRCILLCAISAVHGAHGCRFIGSVSFRFVSAPSSFWDRVGNWVMRFGKLARIEGLARKQVAI